MEHFLGDINGRYASNKKDILALCSNKASYSVADLSRELCTSIPRVTRIVNEMIQEGYLVETGKQESATGRRPSLYGLNPAAGEFVGIDVEQDSISIAVTDFPGRLVHFSGDLPFHLEGNESSVAGFCTFVQDHLTHCGFDLNRIRSYGVDLTGRVNYRTGYSYSYFISEGRPIQSLLQAGFGKPVSVENDSRAMAYGEYMMGVSSKEGTILFLNVGWGLGMGIVMDGKLFTGKSGFSGEIGHFPMLDNNLYCRCGKIGCLETGASGSALYRLMSEKLREGCPSSLTRQYLEGKGFTLDDILQAVDREDVTAIECVEKVGATLGRALAGLINLFNPDLVVVGGRVSVTERYLMPTLKSAVNKYSLNLVNNDTVIMASRLGKEAGAIGSSLLSKSRLLDQLK